MRANKKFLKEVQDKLKTLPHNKRIGYLRGCITVGGNTATTKELTKMLNDEMRGN